MKLTLRSILVVTAMATIAGIVIHHAFAAPPRKYKRIKPDTSGTDSGGVFFKDVFSQGLEGERPANLGSSTPTPPNNSGTPTPMGGGPTTPMGSGKGWEGIVSAQTIEDEIKAIKLEVDKNVTTPSAFNGLGHKRCRKDFTLLAMLFAIIDEYDGEVRFKDSAPAARDMFAHASRTCKVGTTASYNMAKTRKAELGDLVRGSAITQSTSPVTEGDWGQVAERAQLMKRIDAAQRKLRELTANDGAFKGDIDVVVHEAEMLAAMAETMMQNGMPDADDDDYKGYCEIIKTSALEIINSAKLKSVDGATKAMAPLGRSCDDCHELYRG